MNRKEKKIMGLTTTSHSLVHLFEGVLPPLIPLVMVEFNTDYLHMGIIVSIFSYAFGLGSLPAGILADRIGSRRLVTVFLFGAGVSSAAVMMAGSFWIYALLMGLIGAFCSTYHPASNTLISLSIREKGKGFGIHGIAGSLGVAIVPALSAWIGSSLGWRSPYLLYGVLGVAIGFFSLTVPRPQRVVRKTTGEDRLAGGGSVLTLVIFFMSATALGLTYKGIMTFLPVYLGQSVPLGMFEMDTVTLGGTIATFALISGALGQYAAGRLVDRFPAENLYLLAVSVGTVFVFIMAMGRNLIIVVAAVVYAFFYFATQPIQNYMIARYLPEHRHGMGYGIHFFLTFGVGSTAAAVCGYLGDRFGLPAIFYGMGLCFVISSILATVLVFRARTARRTLPVH